MQIKPRIRFRNTYNIAFAWYLQAQYSIKNEGCDILTRGNMPHSKIKTLQ